MFWSKWQSLCPDCISVNLSSMQFDWSHLKWFGWKSNNYLGCHHLVWVQTDVFNNHNIISLLNAVLSDNGIDLTLATIYYHAKITKGNNGAIYNIKWDMQCCNMLFLTNYSVKIKSIDRLIKICQNNDYFPINITSKMFWHH